ncbi:MAG: PD-(D/E)XK nuclease family protein [Proteobacteria bacterium]|nr:PD-(D/E)XK nuclease family protein [Pseudomonadota bacterium]
MESKLVELLKNSATLLVPSRRLGASVRSTVNGIFAQSEKIWDTPRIYTLDDWLQALWDQFEIAGLVTQLLLTSTQSLLQFEDIIARSPAGKSLLRQFQAAKIAQEAWHHLHFWLTTETIAQPPENCDQAAFQAWAKEYQTWLDINQFVDKEKLPQILLPWLLDTKYQNIISHVSLHKVIILYGFEELPPIYTRFFNLLASGDWQVIRQDVQTITPQKIIRTAYLQQEDEWVGAANWAKALLLQGKKNIAIIAPNLADIRQRLDNVFKDTLEPFHLLNPSLKVCQHFNISAATPLIQYPIMLDALTFLKLGAQATISEWISCLSSPFFHGFELEKFDRLQLINILRACHQLSLSQLLALIDKHEALNVVHVRESIVKLMNFYATLPAVQTYSQWAHIFQKILSLVGWPGERCLNSVEYQLVKRFDELLEELGLYDIFEPTSYAQALNTLNKLMANIPFQPENKDAKIQILGLLEGAGATFDYLWIMGMHSEAWPPHPTPNPFIPIELQRRLEMPHAGAQRELRYAQKMTDRFKQSAQEIIFSYATKEKEKSLTYSELIQDLPLVDSTFCKMNRCENEFNLNELEEITDEKAPVVQEVFQCGTNVLELQATCPFKAFAQVRLKLKQPQKHSIWLQPHQQGELIHQVLAEFWVIVKTQAQLLKLTQTDLHLLIEELTDKQLNIVLGNKAPAAYREVEHFRITQMLHSYVQLEKQRLPFKVVKIEKKQNYQIGDLHFSIRLDRIDETEKGEYILVDYKTGKFELSGLWGSRLISPQLPLYFLANTDLDLKGLMVIKLKSDGVEYAGLSEYPLSIDGIKLLNQIEDNEVPKIWSDLNQYWQKILVQLAQNFKQGQAQLDPIDPQLNCRVCHLKPLCRIYERQKND